MQADWIGLCRKNLSIDDFGTGYSSLAYLKRLPVDEVKIDKSFVLEMATDAGDRTIVGSIIELAHNFRLKVTAEGVENTDTMDMLCAMGCEIAQGFHIARPMDDKKLHEFIQDSDWRLPGDEFGSRSDESLIQYRKHPILT